KATYQNDRTRIAELEAFWRADTNPAETYRLFSLITAAIKADQVAVRPGEFSRNSPWISTFVARVDTVIGSEEFKTGQMFTLKLGSDGEYFGRGFERLGFLPGTQRPKPKPQPQPQPQAQAPPRPQRQAPPRPQPQSRQQAGRPKADTAHHGDSKGTGAKGTPGIPAENDICILPATSQRPQRRASRADTEQLRALWRADPDPAGTIAFHEQILAAVRAGSARQHGDEALRDCPWSQVYVAVNQVTIGGVQLQRNEKFALDVGISGGRFRRRID